MSPSCPNRPGSRARARACPRVDPLEDRTLLNATLDPAFGIGGKATVPFLYAWGEANDVAVQPDGRIVAVGAFNGPNTQDFSVARYLPDGALDPSFSGDGVAAVAFDAGAGGLDVAHGVALMPDGRIVVVGQVEVGPGGDYAFGIARLTTDGRLDPSFDADGKAIVNFNQSGGVSDVAADVAIHPYGTDLRIVVVGEVEWGAGGDIDFGIAVLNEDGSPYIGFDGDGRDTLAFDRGGSNDDRARAVAIQADGMIVVAGTADNAPGTDFAAGRIDIAGNLDVGFNFGGRLSVAFDLGGSNDDDARDVLIQPDNRIVIVGTADTAGDSDFAAVRLLPGGGLDGGFGVGGKTTVNFSTTTGSDDAAASVALDPANRLVLAGTAISTVGTYHDYAVARLDPSGNLDPTFAGTGMRTIPFNLGGSTSDIDFGNAVAVHDGRILVAGGVESTAGPPIWRVGLVRLLDDGQNDFDFGEGGTVNVPYPYGDQLISDMIALPDGRIILAGSITTPGGVDFAIARLDPDGRYDPSFGNEGLVTIPFNLGGSNDDRAEAVALQGDHIIVVGDVEAGGGGDYDFGIARLDPDGNLDPSFGNNGTTTVAFDQGGSLLDEAEDVVIQPDGKIVVVGSAEVALNQFDFAIARLNPDGGLDTTSFNPTGTIPGRLTVPFDRGGTDDDSAKAVTLYEDGLIVVGRSQNPTDYDFALARIAPDGTLAPGFGTLGDGRSIVRFDVPGGDGQDFARAVAVQPSDGKILVAGDVTVAGTLPNADTDFGVARLLPDGTLDPSFDGDGLVTVPFNRGGNNQEFARDLSIQRNGRIVVAGYAQTTSVNDNDFAVARLTPDGSLDPAFSTDGKLTVRFDLGSLDSDRLVSAVTLEGDTLLLAGNSSTDTPLFSTVASLARLQVSALRAPTDFDGDGQTDLALYHHDGTDGVFTIRRSSDKMALPLEWVIPNVHARVVPVYGDFDGDGYSDPAVVDPLAVIAPGTAPNATEWIIRLSSRGYDLRRIAFGAAGVLDRPAPADFDGDGITDIATFRATSDLVPGAAQWFILPSLPNGPGFETTNGAFSVVFGAPGGVDLPAVADYDGDGLADIATFRPIPTPQDVAAGVPDLAQWFVLPSQPNRPNYTTTTNGFPVRFGAPSNLDQPIPADYDGDGLADIATFRSETDLPPLDWFILPSQPNRPNYTTTTGGYPLDFGDLGDIGLALDDDNDGRPEIATYTPATGQWGIRPSADPAESQASELVPSFGPTGDHVVPVLAPLYFRLRATDNLSSTGAASLRRDLTHRDPAHLAVPADRWTASVNRFLTDLFGEA